MVDTAFIYESELVVCSFLHDLPKGKGSSLQIHCNAHTVFYFVGQNKWPYEMIWHMNYFINKICFINNYANEMLKLGYNMSWYVNEYNVSLVC